MEEHFIFSAYSGQCQNCKEYALVLVVDTSGDGYGAAEICEDCVRDIFRNHRLKK